MPLGKRSLQILRYFCIYARVFRKGSPSLSKRSRRRLPPSPSTQEFVQIFFQPLFSRPDRDAISPALSLFLLAVPAGSGAELRVHLKADHGAPSAEGLRLPPHAGAVDTDATAAHSRPAGTGRSSDQVTGDNEMGRKLRMAGDKMRPSGAGWDGMKRLFEEECR